MTEEYKDYERYEITNLLAGHPFKKTVLIEKQNRYRDETKKYFDMQVELKNIPSDDPREKINNMINEQLLQQQLDTVSAALYDMCMYQYGALYQPLLDKYKHTRIHSDLLAQIIYDFMSDPEERQKGYQNDGNLNHFLNGIRYSLFDYAEQRLTQKAKDESFPLAWKPTTRNIDKVIFPLDKVNNSLSDIAELGAAGGKVIVGSPKNNITVDVTITTDKDEDRRIITEKHSYAREVLKYASNLWENVPYKTFNASDVYKVMHPEYEGKTVPVEAEKEIERILLAWSRTMIVLDATSQGENWHPVFEWGDGSEEQLETTGQRRIRARIALPAEVLITEYKRNKGEFFTKTVFMFNPAGHPDQPVLWEYAHKTRQILPIPPQLLINPTVSHSWDTVSLRDYLLRELLKTQHRNNTFLYDTIAKDTGIKLFTRHHKQTFRNNLIKILDDFISKEIITGYEEIKEGRSFTKVVITKAEQQPTKKKVVVRK